MSTSGVGYEQLNPPLKAMINAAAGGEGGGAAGSFIVVPRTSTVKLTSDSNRVNIQISDFDKDFDTLLVFKNSVYIGQGVAYNVISNTQIQSIDNSNWVAGTTFQFVCLHVNRAPSVLKCVSIKNEINLTTNSTFIDIGVRDFDKDADTLLLFENGVYMEKDLDYRIDGSKIYPIGDTMFRGTPDCPLVFNMIVLRNVVDPDSVKDFEGSNIKDLTITMDKLTQDIQNILNNPQDRRVGNMSLLRTNSKDTLVNSINELFQYASDGKTLVANAITGKGIESNSNMTFQQLATNISNIKTGYTSGDVINDMSGFVIRLVEHTSAGAITLLGSYKDDKHTILNRCYHVFINDVTNEIKYITNENEIFSGENWRELPSYNLTNDIVNSWSSGSEKGSINFHNLICEAYWSRDFYNGSGSSTGRDTFERYLSLSAENFKVFIFKDLSPDRIGLPYLIFADEIKNNIYVMHDKDDNYLRFKNGLDKYEVKFTVK